MPEPTTLILRKAGTDDVDRAVAIIREASDWLAERGFDWLRSFPGGTPRRVADGKLWLAYLAEAVEPIATVALETTGDPEFWSPQESDALFVHSLAVRRNVGGLGIGSALLDFAGDQAARRQLPWIRLDCNKANEPLQAYYRRQGFSYLRTVDLPHRVSGALFQRQAALSTSIRPDDRGPERFIISFQ